MDKAKWVANKTLCEVEHVSASTRVFAAYYVEGEVAMPLGALTVDEAIDYVELVFVQKDFRRMGIASALLKYAREVTGLRLDYDGGDRSPEGQEWAQAQGLRCQGRPRKLAQREADTMGSRLMVQLYGAYPAAVRTTNGGN